MTTLQNHIHLDLPANVDSDGAPTARYKVNERSVQPVVQTEVSTSWTGLRHRSTIIDDGGDPVLYSDYKFRVILTTQAELDTITNLLGRTVKFVDSYHLADGEDVSSYVKDVAVVSVADIMGWGMLWQKILLTIELREL